MPGLGSYRDADVKRLKGEWKLCCSESAVRAELSDSSNSEIYVSNQHHYTLPSLVIAVGQRLLCLIISCSIGTGDRVGEKSISGSSAWGKKLFGIIVCIMYCTMQFCVFLSHKKNPLDTCVFPLASLKGPHNVVRSLKNQHQFDAVNFLVYQSFLEFTTIFFCSSEISYDIVCLQNKSLGNWQGDQRMECVWFGKWCGHAWEISAQVSSFLWKQH